ncbi:venom allergen 5.02-like isoform X1 [Bombus pyrosoma]|uniref:venom allergen 5.02-like isoform X1 n=1 Tax=Bombus pyrosoma TaxID=396416 RepID=UPI001CB98339|nr:venom allergen 5.02-like isoform X1 [Bombus pyrosoma]XP_043602416.1 venom allergen 5.02-like isoform X1 [Bombus pyrosoma]XP_043602417.1 venom allergen 5.02-like isoform X1 [Bombus pyrosoma]
MMLDRNARQLTLILTVVSVASANNLWPSCSGKTMMRSTDLSCEEKQTILDEHNRLRQLVALGQINGQPSAANMREMIWDDELAAMAQRWTNRCAEIHDDLRNVRRFSVGQNMARAWTTRPPGPYDDQPNWRQMINGWFDEVHHYQTGYSDATGHYTQLVWGDTYLVGCGYSFYYDPARGYTKNYVCNYGPSGNVIGFEPYQSGQPACGNYGMLYSNRYAGLCCEFHVIITVQLSRLSLERKKRLSLIVINLALILQRS